MLAGRPSVSGPKRVDGRRRIESPVAAAAESLTHIGACIQPPSHADPGKQVAGVRTAPNSGASKGGGKKGATASQGAAGSTSESLAVHAGVPLVNEPDRAARKKLLQAPTGDGGAVAGDRGRGGRAGCAGLSTADSLIFQRDLDGSDGAVDTRDFAAAAGLASSATQPERHTNGVRYEDIPHSRFSAPGRRLGGAPDDAARAAGAFGAPTAHTDARLAQHLGGTKVRLRSARGGAESAERLIFGARAGGAPAAEQAAFEAALYSGAGVRSAASAAHNAARHGVVDVASRSTAHLTDQTVYGAHLVVNGARPMGTTLPQDPRDFGGSAGAATHHLNSRRATTFDIDKMPGGCGADRVEYSGSGVRSGAGASARLRSYESILSAPAHAWDHDEWAGSSTGHFQPGQPGQRKWDVADDDVVGVRSAADVGMAVYEAQLAQPYAGAL
jgi:hypothetical protein